MKGERRHSGGVSGAVSHGHGLSDISRRQFFGGVERANDVHEAVAVVYIAGDALYSHATLGNPRIANY